MLISEKAKNLDTDGLQQQAQFNVKLTGATFKALSDSLYSDKPGSIVRELYSNAYDSHVLAGKADVPAEIHLPTIVEPVFYVRDFGVGLSNDEVMSLYSTYFDSTKRSSNDFIGGFGLGSKTPFAYTDQFVVISWQGGYKRQYSCFIGENETPQIALLTSEPSAEPTGLKIEFAVKPADFNRFFDAAQSQLEHFRPRPVFVGVGDRPIPPWVERTPTLEGTNWKFFDRGTSRKASIIVGQVGYPISVESDDLEKLFSKNKECLQLLSLDIEITVPVGAVEVTVSREALSMNKKTLAYLAANIPLIVDELVDVIAEKLSKIPTPYLAQQWLHTFTKMFSTNHAPFSYSTFGNRALRKVVTERALLKTYKVSDLRYKMDVTETITWRAIGYYDFTHSSSQRFRVPPTTYSPKDGGSLPQIFELQDRQISPATENLPVLWRIDVPDYQARLFHSQADLLVSKEQQRPYIYLCKTDDDTWAKLVKALGDPPTALISSLPAPPKAQVTTARSKLELGECLIQLQNSYYWSDITVPPTSGHFVYTKAHEVLPRTYNPEPKHILTSNMAEIVRIMTSLGKFSGTLYGVLVKGHAKAKKSKDFKEFFTDVVDPAAKELFENEEVLEWAAHYTQRQNRALKDSQLVIMLDIMLQMKYDANKEPLITELMKLRGHWRPKAIPSELDALNIRRLSDLLGTPLPAPAKPISTDNQTLAKVKKEFPEIYALAHDIVEKGYFEDNSAFRFLLSKLVAAL